MRRLIPKPAVSDLFGIPIVVPLFEGMFAGTDSISTCVTARVVKDIRKHPAAYYVNVQCTPELNGAVRGQLEKKQQVDARAPPPPPGRGWGRRSDRALTGVPPPINTPNTRRRRREVTAAPFAR